MSDPHTPTTRRLDDLRFVRGRGRYVDDLRLPAMLHLAFVRSPHAHARILRVDRAGAADLPGVAAVLTADDLGAVNRPLMPMVAAPAPRCAVTQRPLAPDRVRFAGEAVAAVVADTPYRAADAVRAVAVDYDPLPGAPLRRG